MKFATAYENRPVPTGEKNSGKSDVETAGYITPKRQIEDMILAGKRLDNARKSKYDTFRPEDDLAIDPTRKPGMDVVEAQGILNGVRERHQVAKASKMASKQPVKEDVKPEKSVPPPDKGG